MAADGRAVGQRREIEQSRKEAETCGVGGDRIVVMLATYSKTVAISEQGCLSTTL